MSAMLRSRSARGVFIVAYLALGALAAVMLVGAPHVPLAGSTLGLMLAFALALGPIALPLAVARPLIVPLALWAALVPFDNLLKFGGPVEKLLGMGAALAAILSILVRHRSFAPPLSAATWGAYAIFAIASLAWAGSPDYGILLLGQVVGLLLVGVFVSMVAADGIDLKALYCGVVAGGVAASLYSVVQYVKLGHSSFMELTGVDHVIDHNHFGAALLLPLICATMAAVASTGRWVRAGSGVAALICLAGIGSSQSRGAMIAYGVAVIFILVRSRYRMRLLPFAVALPLLLAAVPGVAARFSDPDASNGAGRFEIWQIGFAAFKHHWFGGSGFGTFRQSYQAAFLEFSQQSDTAQRVQDSHNLIVQNGVELGIIGLGLVLVAWWFQFRTLRMIGPNSGWGDLRVTMEAATVALFAMTLSVDLMWYKYTWLAFYATWIVRAAYMSAASRRSVEPVLASPQFAPLARVVPAQEVGVSVGRT